MNMLIGSLKAWLVSLMPETQIWGTVRVLMGCCQFSTLWAQRSCLPVTPSFLSPGLRSWPIPALPFLGLLIAAVLVPLPKQEEG